MPSSEQMRNEMPLKIAVKFYSLALEAKVDGARAAQEGLLWPLVALFLHVPLLARAWPPVVSACTAHAAHACMQHWHSQIPCLSRSQPRQRFTSELTSPPRWRFRPLCLLMSLGRHWDADADASASALRRPLPRGCVRRPAGCLTRRCVVFSAALLVARAARATGSCIVLPLVLAACCLSL